MNIINIHCCWVNRQHTKQSVSFWHISPTDTDAMACPNLWFILKSKLSSRQHDFVLTKRKMCKEKVENDPRMDQTGYISSLMDHCLFRCSCLTGMEQPKHESDPSFNHIFPISSFVKSKGKRTPSHPNCLSCAHARGVTWHIRAGEEQRCWKLRQISQPAGNWNQILSSENATHL